MKRFLANEYDRAHAQKRGGHQTILSLDFENAEQQYTLEPVNHLTPERLYEKSWALTVLERIMKHLETEMTGKGKQTFFEHLRVYLGVDASAIPYGEVAETLGINEGTARVAVHRLRKRCRELLREEIAQTVASEDQIDDEIRGLFSALSA
jgi:RNA polymerase sigma-70 factor (ECF subfamily)